MARTRTNQASFSVEGSEELLLDDFLNVIEPEGCELAAAFSAYAKTKGWVSRKKDAWIFDFNAFKNSEPA